MLLFAAQLQDEMAWRLVQASPAALLAARRGVLLRLSFGGVTGDSPRGVLSWLCWQTYRREHGAAHLLLYVRSTFRRQRVTALSVMRQGAGARCSADHLLLLVRIPQEHSAAHLQLHVRQYVTDQYDEVKNPHDPSPEAAAAPEGRAEKLPPNTRAKIQPMDQGIIYCVKREVLTQKMTHALGYWSI
ncbi:hypothetical protein PC121_g10815 [Phytophthora cactorum]|nr:hypothetical protein PC120_g9198 [Phytophthora cactorum]KAG3066524.1 hypothetical protein PC121_g10815 [Phytophthora cactorum]KAG4055695.1 hypothetical protein PC123_g9213 [Phytophthora cactorum]